jgi:hypothetical protein
MAKTNYSYEKRQQELKKQKKRQEKLQRKLDKKKQKDSDGLISDDQIENDPENSEDTQDVSENL